MEEKIPMAYGPVPSRRLGRSVGVNNIPPKICSYSCVYCQLGITRNMESKRRSFYDPKLLLDDVRVTVKAAERSGDHIDHITFVPDGEPTLDLNLGKEIDMVRDLGYPVAVITNSSLMDREDVRRDLAGANVISVKVDSANREIWKKVNRPHKDLNFDGIMEGLRTFSDEFKGSLITETMLVKDLNDDEEILKETAEFIRELNPHIAYISLPIRPPSEKWVEMPGDDKIRSAMEIYSSEGLRTVCLSEREFGDFAYTGDVKRDILAITSVHPMREDSVEGILKRSGEGWDLVDELVRGGDLTVMEYDGIKFYRRKFWKNRSK